MSGHIFELIHSSVFATSNNTSCFQKFLKSCSEQGAFYSRNNIDALVKSVNNCLNSSFDKEKGLSLLLVCLPQITLEAYAGNATSWMTLCNKIINNQSTLDGLALSVLGNLMKSSNKFPEVVKETAKQIVPKFLQDNVRKEKHSVVSVAFLECLQICIQEYSGPSGEYKNDLIRLLLSRRVVEGKHEVVRVAARCVPLLAQLGGGGRQGVSYKSSWHQQQLSIVSILHTLLNNIYQHIYCVVEKEVEPSQDILFKLEEVKEQDILIKTQRLSKQFDSVCQFLQSMLLEEFPVSKSVAPDAILDVVSHAQKPTHMTLGTSREELAVISVLPTIQVAALRLLEALVLCLGRNLIPQGRLINFLCSQTIVWTNKQLDDWPYTMDKPFRGTRLAAYRCLYSWLSIAGASSELKMLLDKPFAVMLADIHAEKPTVKLRVESKLTENKKQQMLVGLEEWSEKLGNTVANHRLCEQALLTLAQLLKAASALLNPYTFMKVCHTVLCLLEELPVPYSDISCLSALYKLLLTLCTVPPRNVVPPYSTALSAFSAGLHHSDTQVKTTCLSGITYLEKIIHPVAATLYFPLPQLTLNKADEHQSHDLQEEDDHEPRIKKKKVNFEVDEGSVESIVKELSIEETEPKSFNKSDEKLQISESNESVEIIYANLTDKEHSQSTVSDNEVKIVTEIIHSPEIYEPANIGQNNNPEENLLLNSFKERRKDSADDIVENLVENKESKITSSDVICLDENKTNVESQDKKAVCESSTDTIEPTEVPETMDESLVAAVESKAISEEIDEDVSQMLSDFKDEVD